MIPFKITDKIIFVNIKNSYEAWKNNDRSNPLYRESKKECTVKYWRIPNEKASVATHILGCYKGKVVEVVRITKCGIQPDGEYAGRKVFEGIEENDSPYYGFDIRELFDTLANFNTKYWGI